ncbi:hypothetical protein [Wenzhouxiangella sp. XN24]|uniref:hypothetical protein n=1 Tax=Wenzhouxiangella sp. XN24 TaxID=2713569 RepID=UPI0013ED04AE|nr:hypothetical protein [Wenzhouxiangella sp. XN24]NGX17195.1 hypothetical protein [Wenzhouxiangella sp. XN24]
MPYKEKTAWLALLAMVVAFGPYFAIAATTPPDDMLPNLRQLSFFAIAVVVQLIILAIGHLLLRRSSPDEAGAPADERDRLIQQRAVTYAYHVLISGVIMVAIVMPFFTGGWAIVNAAIFMIVLAEFVSYGVTVGSYRRQS